MNKKAMPKTQYNGIQDERIKNIEKDIQKICRHVEVLNHETGDLAKDYAFIRANVQAIAETNRTQNERICNIESKIDKILGKIMWGLLLGIMSFIITQILLKLFI